MKLTRQILIALPLIILWVATVEAQPASKTFERIFGMPRALPAELVEAVKTLPAGEALRRDTDGDGQTDEIWYLDTAKRHTISPLLVMVRDEDGDMDALSRGDLDSDLYFWDYEADGFIDVVTDYQDDDGDNDLDQMGIFYDKNWQDEKDDLTVWWSVDIGDDNLLWYDVNGNYYQNPCQWRTHFSGDELFYQFRLTGDDPRWLNVWEDPFAFYDPDDDTCSEVVVRISAIGDDIRNLRYSVDADDDANGRNTHNYDFSVTGIPPASGMQAGKWATSTLTIRGIETHPVLPWERTREFADTAPWGKLMLTWDEINSNTDADIDADPNERWEGILNHASRNGDFPQVGGPACSAFNKRVEVAATPEPPIRLYYDEADKRLHLLGADYGYLEVDYDLDGVADGSYAWNDTDGDGIHDRRTADLDADGTVDIEFSMGSSGSSRSFPIDFEPIAAFYPNMLREHLDDSQAFIDAAVAALGKLPPSAAEVIEFYSGALYNYHPEREVGRRIQNSPGGARLYVDLTRDRLFLELSRRFEGSEHWHGVAELYLKGDIKGATKRLVKQYGARGFGDASCLLTQNGRTYSKRITLTVEVSRPRLTRYDRSPVVLDVSSLRAKVPDFNPGNAVVVEGERWLAWRTIPHQVDSFDGTNEEQLVFLSDFTADVSKTFHIYYDPDGTCTPDYPQLTNAVLDTPAYVAWESDAGAYRFYTGQFDFFGKQEGRLLAPEDRLIYPLVDVDYHAEQDWGIDALHVGKTSGLGGLTLHKEGNTFPVQSPAGEGDVRFAHRILGVGPVRAAIEIVATNVLPETPEKAITLRALIYAHHAESEVQVRLPEGVGSPMLAPGLLRLEEDAPFVDEALGVIGTWGRQEDGIGEVGLAVLAEPEHVKGVTEEANERRLKCTVNTDRSGPSLRYWILGSWRRGMPYPVAFGKENWRREAALIAKRINLELRVTIGSD